MSGEQNSSTKEAEYEVLGRRNGRVQLEISVPGERRPVQHGMKVSDIAGHPDGERAAIEERVQRIAARHEDPGDELDLPSGGKAEYDPRSRDGRPEEAER